jgi:outer membrane protein TolC
MAPRMHVSRSDAGKGPGRRAAFRALAALPFLLPALLLVGCAHYAPLPLPAAASLKDGPRDLAQDSAAPQAPLTLEAVAALALANNPELKAARLGAAVAAGQVRQAGVLPNPQLSGAYLPLLSGVGTVPAWNVGIAQNIKALLTYRVHLRAARDSQQQVAADIVWQEWQVAGQARQLAAAIMMGDQARPIAAEFLALLADRNARLERAMAAGNATLALLAPDRAAWQAARAALDMLDQQQLARRQQLNALLGLRPDAVLPLATQPDLTPLDPAAVTAQLALLPRRRPDLVALRYGYDAADAVLREAILAQFPDLVLGAGGASDNARVINGGPNATLGLPVFDRNQGNVAIARATRAQLRATYDARLSAVTGEVGALLAQYRQLAAQLERTQRDMPAARAAAAHADQALGAGALDARAHADLLANRLAKEQDIMTLRTALIDRQIALETLTGAGLPIIAAPGGPAR